MTAEQRAAATIARYWIRGAANARRAGQRVDAAWMLAHAGTWRRAALTGEPASFTA